MRNDLLVGDVVEWSDRGKNYRGVVTENPAVIGGRKVASVKVLAEITLKSGRKVERTILVLPGDVRRAGGK